MQLTWHGYSYYPYEKELASREVLALLKGRLRATSSAETALIDCANTDPAKRLTYFSGFANGHGFEETVQGRLERVSRSSKNKQSTRYSVHGLHEYKGKFNPQVVRALLNIFGIHAGASVLDPFCGSGTTLVECAHVGASSYGVDINPLAVYVANVKLQALQTPSAELRSSYSRLRLKLQRIKKWRTKLQSGVREEYLASWFTTPLLTTLEILRENIEDATGALAPIFFVVASNLLREYSLQDPNDLRIRRRKSPLPDEPLISAFLNACEQTLERLEATQGILGSQFPKGKAELCDINELAKRRAEDRFDAAITSPPYATALPYIDTQRLSLVWLQLLSPKHILRLEAALIGSRELHGSNRLQLAQRLQNNAAHLPDTEAHFCLKLERAIGASDGFRRKVVPVLLYRYFASMKRSFETIRGLVRKRGRYALIVGHNHTVLGGIRYDINTPAHLSSLAQDAGWHLDEIIPLQTYQRYGYHAGNAVNAETLLMLSN